MGCGCLGEVRKKSKKRRIKGDGACFTGLGAFHGDPEEGVGVGVEI